MISTRTPEFKAEAIKAFHQAGVSMAAVAMARGINANLLRRWVREAVTEDVADSRQAHDAGADSPSGVVGCGAMPVDA